MDTQPANSNNNESINNTNNRNISIVVSYIHGLGKKLKKTFQNKGIQVPLKGTNNVKTLLMAPKDRDNKLQKSGIIYKFKCSHINCPKEYIGESSRTLGDRGEGTPQGLIPHLPTQQHYRTSSQSRLLHHST